jgi:hypothetical protein
MTRRILRWVRRRACTPTTFKQLAASSPFGHCDLASDGVCFEARLRKQSATFPGSTRFSMSCLVVSQWPGLAAH